jgi:hypothetical protein
MIDTDSSAALLDRYRAYAAIDLLGRRRRPHDDASDGPS